MQTTSKRSPHEEPIRKRIAWNCKRIVVGVESPSSTRRDLHVAADLVRSSGGTLFAVHSVATPPTSPLLSNIPFGPDSRVLTEARQAMSGELERHFPDIRTEVIVGVEDPANLLSKSAKEEGADLIVVGAPGWHGLMQLLAGSLPESLLGIVPCPVMILGPNVVGANPSPQTVLLPLALGGSDSIIVQYAARFDWRLVAVHVLKEERTPPNPTDIREGEGQRREMRGLLEEAGLHPEDADLAVVQGEISTQVSAQAVLIQANLMIVEAFHEGALAGHLPGRLLTELVRISRCPLLAIGRHFTERSVV